MTPVSLLWVASSRYFSLISNDIFRYQFTVMNYFFTLCFTATQLGIFINIDTILTSMLIRLGSSLDLVSLNNDLCTYCGSVLAHHLLRAGLKVCFDCIVHLFVASCVMSSVIVALNKKNTYILKHRKIKRTHLFLSW